MHAWTHAACLCKSRESTMPKRKRSHGRGGGADILETAGPSKHYCSFNSAWKDEEFKIDVDVDVDRHNKTFIAEHNLPFRTGDHFTKLMKLMFPGSDESND